MQNTSDTPGILNVIDRLEVGPARVEPGRLIAPYRVSQNGKDEATELIFKYEENVFDPADPDSQNLADMIAAQVAINYGLFCNEIVFHGNFNETDKKFITGMTENTACEIYVKKLLEPNPFLSGDAASLPPLKRQQYSQAKLTFDEAQTAMSPAEESEWNIDYHKYAILSSGGKDSLLSFGLINDLGYEVHPIFGNESGRHWFTALNSYRYFDANIPNTGRVWMNSDRVFNWMLRHLPFMRQDFANLRSDEYPIRLWTVAVFLFAVLPLLRKYSIGRLVIGDEYDTTRRAAYQGISHYDGLYDQSLYFDRALTYYFRRKNWGIHQFSILRPLSELLVEKILVERYPDLQAHQVSCHAAHEKEGRVYPCGKCEKCRRIVGMLMAIGADPARCGYTQSQIENCLKNLPAKGAHQESAVAQQVLWMLDEKDIIELPEDIKAKIKARPEVLSLRFHPERSPIHGIPLELRQPLYRIYLEHAHGAFREIERVLMAFDPLQEQTIHQPTLYDGV